MGALFRQRSGKDFVAFRNFDSHDSGGHFNSIFCGVENIREGAGGVQHQPLLNTKNHCEKTKKILSDKSSY